MNWFVFCERLRTNARVLDRKGVREVEGCRDKMNVPGLGGGGHDGGRADSTLLPSVAAAITHSADLTPWGALGTGFGSGTSAPVDKSFTFVLLALTACMPYHATPHHSFVHRVESELIVCRGLTITTVIVPSTLFPNLTNYFDLLIAQLCNNNYTY